MFTNTSQIFLVDLEMSRADEKMSRNELPIITAAEVAEHTEKTDCWVILHGGVYDVTSFLAEHPGGPTVSIRLSYC